MTWLEHFGRVGPTNVREAAKAHRATLKSNRLPPSGCFASAKVSEVKRAAAAREKRVRVVHAPIDGNSGHAEVRHFTDDDLALLDDFAAEVFADEAGIFMVRDLAL